MVLFDSGVCTKFATQPETEIFEVRVLGLMVEGSSSWAFMLLVASGVTVYLRSCGFAGVQGLGCKVLGFRVWGFWLSYWGLLHSRG